MSATLTCTCVADSYFVLKAAASGSELSDTEVLGSPEKWPD
jgi:hypothetical protein